MRRPTPEEVRDVKKADRTTWVPKPLPEDPSRFFKGSDLQLFPLKDLRPTRARPQGIKDANRLMWLAYWGVQSKREPISLQAHEDGTYSVQDGNSTFANAELSGWKSIAGKVVE